MKRLIGTFLLLGLLLGSPLRAFISPDPEGHVASMDLYSYCDGDPVNHYDADGRIGKGAATGVALGGFGQYDNTTQQIGGLVGQVGSYFVPGLQEYAVARDVAYSGYSASTAAYDIGQNGLNIGNGLTFASSVAGIIPGAGVLRTVAREEAPIIQESQQSFSQVEQSGPTINLGSTRSAGTPSAITMNQALEQASQHVGPVNSVGISGSSSVQAISSTIDAEGNIITKIARFDINPESPHVQQYGPHLNLETQINGKTIRSGSLADPHTPIDQNTILPGDF